MRKFSLWLLAGLSLFPALSVAAAEAPAVLFTDIEAGPVSGGPGGFGVPIAIFGRGFGATRGASKVTINGTEVAAYLIWGQNNANNSALDMIVVQPSANTTAGAVVVSVGGLNSNTDYRFTPTAGKIHYVAPSGSDGAPCTQSQPCATIQHAAADIMQPGDAVLVRGGTLNDDEVWIRDVLGHSGAAGKPKIIRNYPGEMPRFSVGNRPFILDAHYITLSGIHFQNGKSLGVGGDGGTARGNRLYNNTFRGVIDFDAVGTHAEDVVIAGNDCDVPSSTQGTQGHCFYISNGSNIRLRYNIARGAPGYGIHIFDQRRSANDFRRVISNVLVEGNLLAASPERSGLIVAMGDEAGLGNYIDGVTIRNNLFVANNFAGVAVGDNVRNTKIYHNTFYQNGRQGVTLYNVATITGVEVFNNLFDQSANANCRANCSWYQIAHVEKGAAAQNVVIANNFYAPAPPVVLGASDSAPASGAPGFVDAGAGNYRLSASSAAIGKGRALPQVARDYDGRTRSATAPDAGAFEHTGGGGGGSGTTLGASPASAAAGATISVSWNNIAAPTPTDWIGLFRPGAPSQSWIDWIYVNCSKRADVARGAGSCAFTIPASLPSGSYELRLHAANGFAVIANSAAISITGTQANASLNVSPASLSAGGSATASWSNVAAPTATDWIGLFRAGAPSQSWIDWIYVSCTKRPDVARASGSCAFAIPSGLTSGGYELRLHTANGFTVIANNAALTLQ